MGNKNRSKDVEREAANGLQTVTREDWQRVPQSGATATQHNTDSHVFNGDVFNERTYNDICVEVKKMKNMKASHVWEPTKRIKDHIRQARDESDEKYLLLMKINYQGWFMYVDPDSYHSDQHNNYTELVETLKTQIDNAVIVNVDGHPYRLYYIKDFKKREEE